MPQLFIADDNPEFSTFVSEVASDLGWAVTLCVNGQDLLDQLAMAQSQVLVFLDVLMPEMDGIEAIKQLAQIDRAIRVRFMTGGAISNAEAAERIAEARGLSVGPILLKPISLNKLRGELQAELETLSQ